jgi:hypothetical protein
MFARLPEALRVHGSHAMAASGSFGWLQARYEIDDDHVTLSRNVWLPWLVVVAGLALPSAAVAFSAESWLSWSSGIVGVIAMLVAMKTPWHAPARVVFSRRGLTWGPYAFSRVELASVHTIARPWKLVVTTTNGQVLTMSLGKPRNWGTYLDGAIVHVLADRRASSRLRSASERPLTRHEA